MGNKYPANEKFVNLYQQGFSRIQIADRMQMTVNQVSALIQRHRRNGQLPRRGIDEQKQGEKHNRAKLTEEQARQVIVMYLGGYNFTEIAEHYGLQKSTPRDICNGKSWKRLQPEFRRRLVWRRKRK